MIYVIWKPVCDFLLVINSNLGRILHRLATIHSLQTDGQTDRQTDDNHDKIDDNHDRGPTFKLTA